MEIVHEIHRGRITSNPWALQRAIAKLSPCARGRSLFASRTEACVSRGRSKGERPSTLRRAPRATRRGESARVRLVADYSHFLAACEAEPGEEPLEEALSALHGRVRHVHARVGFGNGPQVGDPRDPGWRGHLEAHVRWWGEVWARQRERGCARWLSFGRPRAPPLCPCVAAAVD